MSADDGVDTAELRALLAQQGVAGAAGGSTKRRRKAGKAAAPAPAPPPVAASTPADVEVVYTVPDMAAELESLDRRTGAAAGDGSAYSQLAAVFRRFQERSSDGGGDGDGEEAADDKAADADGAAAHHAGAAGTGAGADAAVARMSHRERRRALQLALAELKRHVARADAVEAHDVTAADPLLLVQLKSARNTVPVPIHWLRKSRYLNRKRGFEKPPFALPDFIAATGITKMRNEDLDASAEKTTKSKQRERYVPKMGRITIDYQVLHDAFFRHQTKPRLTPFGDLYYEGKEFERKFFDKKPGVLSARLREALAMPEGAPPPWLIKMQQYGPPPSYPSLRIPGVNAPLPPGASYGMHPGGWGRPPVDMMGRPLYGDVFGVQSAAEAADAAAVAALTAAAAAPGAAEGEAAAGSGGAQPTAYDLSFSATQGGKRRLWGEYVIPREELALTFMKAAKSGTATSGGGLVGSTLLSAEAIAAGTATPADGTASVAGTITTGMATPDVVDLRKGPRAGAAGLETPESVASGPPQQLYRVLEEKRTSLTGALLGTTHGYVIPEAAGAGAGAGAGAADGGGGGGGGGGAARPGLALRSGASGTGGDVELALAPEELERIDTTTLAKKYQEEVSAAAAGAALGAGGKDDVSDMLQEQEARKRKRKEAGLAGADGAGGGGSKAKRAKEFKF